VSPAPSGTTPWVANLQSAIRSFRASATTMILRRRRAEPPWVCRRLVGLGYAARAGASPAA
jgi:hypothetical protein